MTNTHSPMLHVLLGGLPIALLAMYSRKYKMTEAHLAFTLNITDEFLTRVKTEIREELILVEHYIIKNNVWYYNYEAFLLFQKGIAHFLDLKYT